MKRLKQKIQTRVESFKVNSTWNSSSKKLTSRVQLYKCYEPSPQDRVSSNLVVILVVQIYDIWTKQVEVIVVVLCGHLWLQYEEGEWREWFGNNKVVNGPFLHYKSEHNCSLHNQKTIMPQRAIMQNRQGRRNKKTAARNKVQRTSISFWLQSQRIWVILDKHAEKRLHSSMHILRFDNASHLQFASSIAKGTDSAWKNDQNKLRMLVPFQWRMNLSKNLSRCACLCEIHVRAFCT